MSNGANPIAKPAASIATPVAASPLSDLAQPAAVTSSINRFGGRDTLIVTERNLTEPPHPELGPAFKAQVRLTYAQEFGNFREQLQCTLYFDKQGNQSAMAVDLSAVKINTDRKHTSTTALIIYPGSMDQVSAKLFDLSQIFQVHGASGAGMQLNSELLSRGARLFKVQTDRAAAFTEAPTDKLQPALSFPAEVSSFVRNLYLTSLRAYRQVDPPAAVVETNPAAQLAAAITYKAAAAPNTFNIAVTFAGGSPNHKLQLHFQILRGEIPGNAGIQRLAVSRTNDQNSVQTEVYAIASDTLTQTRLGQIDLNSEGWNKIFLALYQHALSDTNQRPLAEVFDWKVFGEHTRTPLNTYSRLVCPNFNSFKPK